MSFFQRLFVGTNVGFANIELDARISERFQVSSTITDHPVDRKALITDHAYTNPRLYTIEGAVSDTPTGLASAVQQIGGNIQQLFSTGTVPFTNSVLSVEGAPAPATKRSVAAFISLIDFWERGTIFNVQTSMGLWENLIIQDLSAEVTNETANMLRFVAVVRQVIRVNVSLVTTDNLEEGPIAQSGGTTVTEGLKQSTVSAADTVTKAAELLGTVT